MPPLFAAAFCGAAEACLGPLVDLFTEITDCENDSRTAIQEGQLPRWTSAIEAGRMAYHGELVSRCLDELEALGCGALERPDTATCDDVFEGMVAAGEPCSFSDECVESAYCRVQSMCPGTCTTRAAAGSTCDDSSECELGLVCTDDGTCGSNAGRIAGEPCEGGMPACQVGLLCVGAEESTPGTCRAPEEIFVGEAGDDCDPTGMSSLCQAGLACVIDMVSASPTFVCVEESPSGAACKVGFPDPCPSDEYCADVDAMALDFDGTCRALPISGESCRARMGSIDFAGECTPGLACVEGTCRSLQRNGASCSSTSECYSGACEDGQCAVRECG